MCQNKDDIKKVAGQKDKYFSPHGQAGMKSQK